MIVALQFDCRTAYVTMPDGYAPDKNTLRQAFMSWVYDNPACMRTYGGHTVYAYDETDFLTFVNTVLLADSRERAYFCPAERVRDPVRLTF